jgi:hypothetical protein
MTVDEEFDDSDDEFDENSDPLYLKYCFEGASSISELAAALRQLAGDLERRAVDGWRLHGSVDGGWAHLIREGA